MHTLYTLRHTYVTHVTFQSVDKSFWGAQTYVTHVTSHLRYACYVRSSRSTIPSGAQTYVTHVDVTPTLRTLRTFQSVDKSFWSKCMAESGNFRVEFVSNTELFPHKPAAYCQREHYTVIVHKKQPPTVFVHQGARGEAKVAASPCDVTCVTCVTW